MYVYINRCHYAYTVYKKTKEGKYQTSGKWVYKDAYGRNPVTLQKCNAFSKTCFGGVNIYNLLLCVFPLTKKSLTEDI